MGTKAVQSLLQRVLSSEVEDAWIPKEKIGENKEYKWRASSVNHEPVLVSNKSGEIVAGAGKTDTTQSEDEPTYYKVDVIPSGKHKGKKGYKYYDENGNAQYIPETPLNKKHIKADYEKPPTPPTPPPSGNGHTYYKVDVIPEGKHKGKKGFKYYDEDGNAHYFPENAFNRKHIKAEYENPQGGGSAPQKEKAVPPAKPPTVESPIKITVDNRPPNSSTTPQQELFWDIYAENFNMAITDKKVSDESVAFLYTTLAKRQRTETFTLTENKDAYFQSGFAGMVWKIQVPDLTKFKNATGTVLHELGHYIDFTDYDGGKGYYSLSKLSDAVRKAGAQPIPRELIEEIVKKHMKRAWSLKNIETEWDKKVFAAKKRLSNATDVKEVQKLKDEYDQMQLQAKRKYYEADMNYWSEHGDGWDALSDICDAISRGHFQSFFPVSGHGKSYFASAENRATEVWADYCNLAVLHPETLKKLEEYYPELVQACREMAKELATKWKGK